MITRIGLIAALALAGVTHANAQGQGKAAGAELTGPQAVLERKTGKPVVLLYDGSNWAPSSGIVNAAFRSMIDFDQAKLPVEYALQDFKEPSRVLSAMSVGQFRPAPWQIPAIYVIDPDGKVCALTQGVSSVADVKKVFDSLPSVVAVAQKRAELFARAEKEKGVRRADLIGQALDTLSLRLARLHKEHIADLLESDPKDESGYAGKYGYNRDAMYDRLRDALNAKPARDEKKLAAVLAEADKLLRNPKLTPEIRQDVMGMRYGLAKLKQDKPAMFAALDAMIAEVPDNDVSVGAKNLKAYYSVPVVVPDVSKWIPRFNRDVPCDYEITQLNVKKGEYDVRLPDKYEVDPDAVVTMYSAGKQIWSGKIERDIRTWAPGSDWDADWLKKIAAAKTPEEKAKLEKDHKGLFEYGKKAWAKLTAVGVTVPVDGPVTVKLRMRCTDNWLGSKFGGFGFGELYEVALAKKRAKALEDANGAKAAVAAEKKESVEAEAEAKALLAQMAAEKKAAEKKPSEPEAAKADEPKSEEPKAPSVEPQPGN